MLVAALGQVVVLWSAELLLARISGEPQTWDDALQSLGILAALGVPGVWAARFVPGERWRLVCIAIVSSAPLVLVTLGILLPLFIRSGTLGIAGFAGCVAGTLVGWRVFAALRGGRAVAGPVAVCGVLAASTLGVWWVHMDGLPPLSIWAPLLAALALVAIVSRDARRLPWVALAGFGVALLPEAPVAPDWPSKGPPPRKPDVILIVVDTLRADAAREMSSYRRLAAEGVEFREAQAAAPWTTPSVGSLLTGLRVREHGARRAERRGVARHRLRPSVRPLAERLSSAGYDTAGLVVHDAAGEWGGFARGFDYWREKRDRWALPRARSERRARPTAARLLTELGLQGRPPSVDGRILTDRALFVLERRRPERPLFLWLQYLDDHLPYRHMERAPLTRRYQIALDYGVAGRFREEPFWRTPEGRRVLRAGYDFEVDFIDRQIQRLLDALGPVPERGRVVVFASDHGEEFFEHGEILHGHALYQELVHVPLVITGLAGREPGDVETRPVGHVDVASTILAAAGVPADDLPGQDLAGPVELRPYVSESLWPRPTGRLIAAREGRFKLIVDREGEPLLFDLETDPGETTSLANEHPELVARLSSSLAVAATPSEAVGPRAELSREDVEMLEALGYAE